MKLQQFRKEESELFDSETGEYYTGTIISPRQCELMRDAINELEESHKELIKVLEHVKGDIMWHEGSPTLNWIDKALKNAKQL